MILGPLYYFILRNLTSSHKTEIQAGINPLALVPPWRLRDLRKPV
jgi:hypothetical protein